MGDSLGDSGARQVRRTQDAERRRQYVQAHFDEDAFPHFRYCWSDSFRDERPVLAALACQGFTSHELEEIRFPHTRGGGPGVTGRGTHRPPTESRLRAMLERARISGQSRGRARGNSRRWRW